MVDLACMVLQYMIAKKVWSRKKNVSIGEIQIVITMICFNPILLVGLSVQNVCQIRDLMSYVAIYMYLDGDNWLLSIPLQSLSLYVDPTAWIYIFGFSILTEDLKSAFIYLVSVILGCAGIMFITGDINE